MPRKHQAAGVLVVVHTLEVGGAETVAVTLAERLRESFEIRFVCLDGGGPLTQRLREKGITVHVFERRAGLDRSLVAEIRGLLRDFGPALVHVHQATPLFYAQAARFPRSRPPILLTEHGRFHPDPRNPKRMLWNRLMVRGADRMVAVGEGVREALVRNDGIPRPRVSVLYNGVDLAEIEQRSASSTGIRSSLGLRDDDLVALHVARLDPIKDHDTALRALTRLGDTLPTLRLLIVGDGPEAERIDRRISDLGLEGRALRLGLRSDVPELLGASDLLLLSSVSEGIPLVLIEAMAAGVPIVSTDVGGVREVVGTTARLVTAGDDRALAKAIEQQVTDREGRDRSAEEARRRAWREFDLDAMVERYRELYDSMTGMRG